MPKTLGIFAPGGYEIKTILWDFDGVIFDGMGIKAEGFAELFGDYPEEMIDEFVRYHYTHGGVSRFEKIRYFHAHIAGEDIDERQIEAEAERFASLISEKLYDESRLIVDALGFIESFHDRYPMHIVSGAEKSELLRICEHFSLRRYFVSIEGSPTPKSELIGDILSDYGYSAAKTLMIGDSITDRDAASRNGVRFCGYNNPALMKGGCYIESFGDMA